MRIHGEPHLVTPLAEMERDTHRKVMKRQIECTIEQGMVLGLV